MKEVKLEQKHLDMLSQVFDVALKAGGIRNLQVVNELISLFFKEDQKKEEKEENKGGNGNS
jgi:hypothetical protein